VDRRAILSADYGTVHVDNNIEIENKLVFFGFLTIIYIVWKRFYIVNYPRHEHDRKHAYDGRLLLSLLCFQYRN